MLLLLLSMHALAGPVPALPPMRYKIVTHSVTDLDLSAVGQASQTVTLTSTTFVSVTVTDTVGGLLAHVVVDSSTFDAGALAGQLPPEMSADAKGAFFHLYVINGKSKSAIIPTPLSVQAAQAATGIELVLNGLRMAKAGDTWVDTTNTDTTSAAGGAKGTRIANWTATSEQGSALQLDATWTGTTSAGFGPTQLEMQVTGASHVTTVPGQLAEKATSNGSGSATMNAGGMNIPMKVTTDVVTTKIP